MRFCICHGSNSQSYSLDGGVGSIYSMVAQNIFYCLVDNSLVFYAPIWFGTENFPETSEMMGNDRRDRGGLAKTFSLAVRRSY
jgi:hypothetical protein